MCHKFNYYHRVTSFMGYTRTKAGYFGVFGILAAIVYVAVFYTASGSVSNWTFGSSDTSVFMEIESYRYGLMAAGTLGALFGLGFIARRDNAAQIIGGITAVFAGLTLVIVGYQAPSVKDNFILIFSALLILTALLDAVSEALNGQYISLVISLVLAIIMAAMYYFNTMYGAAFIITALIWLLFSSLIMIVYNSDPDSVPSGRRKKDNAMTPEEARKAELKARREKRAEARAVQQKSAEKNSEKESGKTEAVPRERSFEENTENESEETYDVGEDIYADTSPEALVRRATWNKGLRCRRDHGKYGIPVAFVGAKVAVYVVPRDTEIPAEEKLKSEGWTVFVFDEEEVTDGEAQAEIVFEKVKEKEKSKKSKKKSKK